MQQDPWSGDVPIQAEWLDRADASMPPSVNYHLWAACNMRCGFCFAPFQDVVSTVLPRGHLAREESVRVVRSLAARFEKVTFAGGEPTLCPWLPELVRAAHDEGATTMLVTNGSPLVSVLPELEGVLDWVTISVDSASAGTLVALGRAIGGKRALSVDQYAAIGQAVRNAGIRLKVNTVVTSTNAGEDMRDFLRMLSPERWKVLRALPVEGQNTGRIDPLLCPPGAFENFVARHASLLADGIEIVPEDNDDMRGSYAMVDPAGRFFDNASGGHRYSRPILSAGIDAAWAEVSFSMEKFLDRGGSYEWRAR